MRCGSVRAGGAVVARANTDDGCLQFGVLHLPWPEFSDLLDGHGQKFPPCSAQAPVQSFSCMMKGGQVRDGLVAAMTNAEWLERTWALFFPFAFASFSRSTVSLQHPNSLLPLSLSCASLLPFQKPTHVLVKSFSSLRLHSHFFCRFWDFLRLLHPRFPISPEFQARFCLPFTTSPSSLRTSNIFLLLF